MNCETFQELLVERIYGRLTEEREAALEKHARECAGCALALERSLGVENALEPGDDIPMPDFDRSWRTIQARVQKKERPWSTWFARRRFAAVVVGATAVMAIFAIGVFTGRSVFPPEPEQIRTGSRGITSIASYTETLEPLLLDFANQAGRPMDDELAQLAQKVATDMLEQTRLLKFAAARSGDESLYVLMDDIELVLISISNLGGQNGEIAGQLERVIRDKSIMNRLKALPAAGQTI